MSTETITVRAWLHNVLDDDGQLIAAGWQGAYHGVAPAGTAFPYTTYQMLSAGNDQHTFGFRRLTSNPLYLLKTVCEGNSTDPIEAIAARIDALLHAASGTALGGIIFSCHRERPFDEPEVTDGTTYQRLGGEYRVLVQGS